MSDEPEKLTNELNTEEEGYLPVKKVLLEEAVGWAKMILFTVLLALLINRFVIVNASVPTGSMEDTIMPNDRIVAFRLSYLIAEPQRYDVVVFRFPDNEAKLYVKRIIGIPGDTIIIREGKVYVNGDETPLRDEFIKSGDYRNYGPYEVPPDHYFMMGDNRSNSEDSRYWINTYVHRDKILGKVIFKYYKGFDLLYGI